MKVTTQLRHRSVVHFTLRNQLTNKLMAILICIQWVVPTPNNRKEGGREASMPRVEEEHLAIGLATDLEVRVVMLITSSHLPILQVSTTSLLAITALLNSKRKTRAIVETLTMSPQTSLVASGAPATK